jgi:hypothetical protein
MLRKSGNQEGGEARNQHQSTSFSTDALRQAHISGGEHQCGLARKQTSKSRKYNQDQAQGTKYIRMHRSKMPFPYYHCDKVCPQNAHTQTGS